MSCWRVLPLSDIAHNVPQLLIKPDFQPKSYTVFLTDLSNIWSEELDLKDILKRAAEQESPIEVSTQDTTQLGILLDHVKQSLTKDADSVCRITKGDPDGVVLHTTSSLPRPLGSLTWRFNLRKRTSGTLKNELILPLLVSSHIQHERVNALLSTIQEKDRAITRFLDQFESSNLDLALAFPSIAGMRPGKRLVKREQAARHIPALVPFEHDDFLRQTGRLKDDDVCTLGLFQEALSQCNPKVPPEMKSQDVDGPWWTSIRSTLSNSRPAERQKQKKATPPFKSPSPVAEDDTETEDEFETHENFKLREAQRSRSKARDKTPVPEEESSKANGDDSDVDGDEETEDDDLDAPSKSQSQSQTRSFSSKIPAKKSPEAKPPSPEPAAPAPKKHAGFRIGGARAKKSETRDLDEETPESSIPTRAKAQADSTPPKPRKTFKIGGKHRASAESPGDPSTASPSSKGESSSRSETIAEQAPATDAAHEPPEPRVSASVEEERDETPEEKAERRRRELKRKQEEELARKQAHKKKKRF